MEINLAAQRKKTWRDFMHLAFLTKLSFSFFSLVAFLEIILFCNLNIIFPAYCEGLTGSICCIVKPLPHLLSHLNFRDLFLVLIQSYLLCLLYRFTSSDGVWETAGWSFRAECATGDSSKLFHAPATVPGVFTSSSYLSCGRQVFIFFSFLFFFYVKTHLCYLPTSWSNTAVQNSYTSILSH